MAGPAQGQGAEEGEHEPGEARHRHGLLAGEATRLDAQEAQCRTEYQENADGEQIAARSLPFAENECRDERQCEAERGDEDQHAQVMADDS